MNEAKARPAGPSALRANPAARSSGRARGDGSLLRVAVVPNARRTGADGLHDGALRVRLAAQPVEGQANARLLAWLADELGCAKRAVRLQRGDTIAAQGGRDRPARGHGGGLAGAGDLGAAAP